MYDAAKRAFSLKQNKAMTHAEFMKELLTSYQANHPLDEESKAKVLEEADKDLQAERARLIPVVAEARQTALEMELIEADNDTPAFVELDPGRVQSGDADELLAQGLGSEFNEGLIAQLNPHRVGSKHTAKLLAGVLGVDSFEAKLVTGMDLHRTQTERAALMLGNTHDTTAINEKSISQVDPHRVQLDPIKNPWASTRVRFTLNARSTTKAQSREILRRDCWCCSTPGYPNRIWLHIHHLESYSQGGKTEPRNLIGLCSACHKNTHDGLLKIERQSDGRLLFFDQNGARLDLQVDLHIAEWLDYEIGWTGGEQDSYKARCGIDWSAVSA